MKTQKRKWFETRICNVIASEYDDTKSEFEKVIGRPKIAITVELPKRFEKYKSEFLSLEENEQFLKKVQKTVQEIIKEWLRQTRKKGKKQNGLNKK